MMVEPSFIISENKMKLNEIRFKDVVSEITDHRETARATKPNLDKEELRVIKKYTSDSFRINNVLHSVHATGKLPLDHDTNTDEAEDAKILNNAIFTHHLKRPLTLFSGVKFDVADLWVVRETDRSNSMLITLPSFTSCSSSLIQAESFSADLKKHVHTASAKHERLNDEDEHEHEDVDPEIAIHEKKFSSILMFNVGLGDPVLSVSEYSYSSGELEYILPPGCQVLIDPRPIHKQSGSKKTLLIWKCRIKFPEASYLQTVITTKLKEASNELSDFDSVQSDLIQFRDALEGIDSQLKPDEMFHVQLGRQISVSIRWINKFNTNPTKFNARKAFLNCSLLFKFWFIVHNKGEVPSKIAGIIKALEKEFEISEVDYTGAYKYAELSHFFPYSKLMQLIH